ncbi:hypothetical protein [Mammaliicoccus sciuri]|uniref:hypothetical protein n=1 Tax=Mammaliicoccus sciuri TaxID=1296 RepID=UPI002737CFA6|nr:hypothetical protein [Mammaliicoccus sciuri]
MDILTATVALEKALKLLGKNINDLKMKDYIAAHHLLNIIVNLEDSIVSLSIKAYENLKELKELNKNDNNNYNRLNNLSYETYRYNMYLKSLSSEAYRNLITGSTLGNKLLHDLELKVTTKLYDNINYDDYESLTKSQQDHYEQILIELSTIHLQPDNKDGLLKTINEIYDAVSIISRVGFIEKLLLKLKIPFIRRTK